MNLYVFSIGGSGVRVLHSLTMLLAAGVKMQSARIIPVIIDTDETNGNTVRMLETIKNYRAVYEKVNLMNGKETVLDNKRTSQTSLFSTEIAEPKIITIDGSKFGNLETIIGENAVGIDPEIKTMLHTIYNDKDLKMPLQYGFIGRPNIGCVVLDYLFHINEEFKNVVNGIKEDDRIFLISSIFGGTGAAGFPLLLNRFNNSLEPALNKKNNLKGALSVTPYYTVTEQSNSVDDSLLDAYEENDGNKRMYAVDSSLFDSKTFAAQLYYDNYIDGDLNAMYYVGDKKYSSIYTNYRGGKNQNNPAHLVELLGALTVAHFDNLTIDKNKNEKEKAALYADKILDSKNADVTSGENFELRNALIRLWMFRRFYINYLPNSYLKNNPPVLQEIGYTQNEYETGKGTFSYNMKEMLESFKLWAEQLSDPSIHARRFKFVDSVTAMPPQDELIHSGFKDFVPKTTKNWKFQEVQVASKFLHLLNTIALGNSSVGEDMNARLVRFAAQAIDEIINVKMK